MMVFNPKTSGALEGDNRKSIRPIKRKAVVERTTTSCIINLSLPFSLSISFSIISIGLAIDRVSRFLLTIQIEYTRRHGDFSFKPGK